MTTRRGNKHRKDCIPIHRCCWDEARLINVCFSVLNNEKFFLIGVMAVYVWLVGCLWFNGPLRQYFSLYRAVSQREGERGEREMIDESKNVQTTPTRTYCKCSSAVGAGGGMCVCEWGTSGYLLV